MSTPASHFEKCPPIGAPSVTLAGDAIPLVHSVIAWCEAEFGTAYSLTQWRAATWRTGEHVNGFTAWYGWGKLTPEVELCPGYRGGTSFLRDSPSSAHPEYRWQFDAWDAAGQRWVSVSVEDLRLSMRTSAGPVVLLSGTPMPPRLGRRWR